MTLMRAFLLIVCVLVTEPVLQNSPLQPLDRESKSELDSAKKEIERLRDESNRLRQERDAYRKDLEYQSASKEHEVSSDLKVLSSQLSKEMKEDFYSSITRVLWILTILVGVATAGGYWKLSDIITSRINAKVDERQSEIQNLREQVMQALVEFRIKAAQAVTEVSERTQTVAAESETALSEIRSRRLALSLQVDSSGKLSTVVATARSASAKEEKWFGELPEGFVAIAGCRFNQNGADAEVANRPSGAFSYFFQKALRDPKADEDGDGKVSLQEAVLAARKALKKANYVQVPVISGKGSSTWLFSLRNVQKHAKPFGSVVALLIGINKYESEGANLRGAVNDAEGMKELLNSSGLLAQQAVVRILTDAKATLGNIMEGLTWLQSTATDKDMVLVYFSGHQATIEDAVDGSPRVITKVIAPHDFRYEGDRFMRVPQIVQKMAETNAHAKVLIIDA